MTHSWGKLQKQHFRKEAWTGLEPVREFKSYLEPTKIGNIKKTYPRSVFIRVISTPKCNFIYGGVGDGGWGGC